MLIIFSIPIIFKYNQKNKKMIKKGRIFVL